MARKSPEDRFIAFIQERGEIKYRDAYERFRWSKSNFFRVVKLTRIKLKDSGYNIFCRPDGPRDQDWIYTYSKADSEDFDLDSEYREENIVGRIRVVKSMISSRSHASENAPSKYEALFAEFQGVFDRHSDIL